MSDVLLTDENVVVVGRLGVGTDNPVGVLHADGSSEITAEELLEIVRREYRAVRTG
jgi:hypothetical protein